MPPKPLSQVAAAPNAVKAAIDSLMQKNALVLSQVIRESADLSADLRTWHGQFQLAWLDQSTAIVAFETPEIMREAMDALGGGKRGAYSCSLAQEDNSDKAPRVNRIQIVKEKETFTTADGRVIEEAWETLAQADGSVIMPAPSEYAPPDAGGNNMWSALNGSASDEDEV